MKTLLLSLAFLPSLLAAPLDLKIVKNTALEIDQALHLGQEKRKVTPTPNIDDPTFLRRSYLNIIGRLPTHQETTSFLSDSHPEKRSNLINSLVDSPGFQSRLFNFWTNLLRVQTRLETAGLAWHVWLKNAVESNMPYDQMVHAMLSAQGHIADDPAVGYYLRDRGMLLDNVSNTVQVFLGHDIGCAQCHDHPFDDTTQLEYYELASFLGGTEYRFDGTREKIREVLSPNNNPQRLRSLSPAERRRQLQKNRQENRAQAGKARQHAQVFRYHQRNAITDDPSKTLKLPADYQYKNAKPGDSVKYGLLFGATAQDVAPKDRRDYFATWITSPENPYFTKVIANRMWEYTFGYGLVANSNDWSTSPDPLYPELLDLLEKAMKATDYDLREFLRILYHTRLFQRETTSSEPAQGFSFDFAGPPLRRMNADEIRDSFITLVSGNVDANKDSSLENSWQEYVAAHQYLMATSPTEFLEISSQAQKMEQRRRQLQGQTATLRTQVRKAQEDGDFRQATALTRELREKQAQARQNYNPRRNSSASDPSPIAQALPAIQRRPPQVRPDDPEFRLRASELPTPSQPGLLVAEFGGTDAESPSASHTEATIPQLLRLLNGFETDRLVSKGNHFASDLRNLDTPEERLDFLFLSLYSTYPTNDEKKLFLPEVQTLNGSATLARAILTSNRFLFVQ